MSMTDKAEAVLAVTFTATQDICGGTQSLDVAPFAIYYPNSVPVPKVNTVNAASTAVSGTGFTGATIKVSGGTIPADTEGTVAPDMTFSVAIPAQTAGVTITVVQIVGGRASLPTAVTVGEAS